MVLITTVNSFTCHFWHYNTTEMEEGWFESIFGIFVLLKLYSMIYNNRDNKLNNILFICNYISVAVIHLITVCTMLYDTFS